MKSPKLLLLQELNLEHPTPSTELIRKLHPARFSAMSPKMAAIVGCILGEKFTEPQLVGLTVTSDGFVLGMPAGGIGFDDFVGAFTDLDRNWNVLLDAAELTPEERKGADRLFALMLRNGRQL
jgi:hypothetical protein